jgi:tetratricopeptide (TPR) repeat protein
MEFRKNMENIRELIKNKEYEKAENRLLELINQSKNKVIEDENNTYYSFNNYVELLIFWNMYRPKKKNIDPDINYSQVYYYLGFINIDMKNYGKAQEYFKKGLQWNPVDVTLMFESAAVYRMLGYIERFRAEIEKAHSFIYDSSYMAKYYRELGWYYVEKRVYDLANALYSQSISFLDTEIARNELMFIAKQENRNARFSIRDEIKKLFSDYNIWSGFNKNTVNLIYEEYQRLQTMKPKPAVVKYLSQRLYDITLDKKFMTYYELKDEEHEVKIAVPDTWRHIEKASYEKYNIGRNTTFFLITPENQTVNIVCDGKCSEEQLDEAFNVNIENMKKTEQK